MTEKKGYFTFILHSHLPYVISHGRWPHGMDWLNEAAAETYVPLLEVMDRLLVSGITPKITIGLTPILCEMLSSGAFREEFTAYLDQKVEASEADRVDFERTARPEYARLAIRWRDHFVHIRDLFKDRYGQDILGAFRKLQDAGALEIITCAATHGYLPLLSQDISIQAQIKAGVRTHERHFGRAPRGIWLPEAAYRPSYDWAPPVGPCVSPYPRKGVEDFLSENGLRYFVVDAHLLKGGKAIGVYLDRFEALQALWKQFASTYEPPPENLDYSPYKPYLVGSREGKRPVAVLTRDEKTAIQVWSGDWGYPGDGWYLDFHKKHFPGGNRYWRVTSSDADLGDKELYDPGMAESRIDPQAQHFAGLVAEVLAEFDKTHDRPGFLTAPFDTELFGHWWFEGPRWIEAVYRHLGKHGIEAITASEYLEKFPARTVVSLPEGSWGEGGYHYIWLNQWTEWTWKHIYECEPKMIDLARRGQGHENADVKRVLKQLAREMLLLQSSDWQFLISTWSARDYAELRFQFHFDTFRRLADLTEKLIDGGRLSDEEWLYVEEVEKRDAVFPDVDPDWWARLEYE